MRRERDETGEGNEKREEGKEKKQRRKETQGGKRDGEMEEMLTCTFHLEKRKAKEGEDSRGWLDCAIDKINMNLGKLCETEEGLACIGECVENRT